MFAGIKRPQVSRLQARDIVNRATSQRIRGGLAPNVVGAAIAQVSDEMDQIFSNMSRNQALAAAQGEAERRAEAAGGVRGSQKLVKLKDIPLSNLHGHAWQVRLRMVGYVGPAG